MMTLANYGIGSSKHKDPNSAKALSKSLQIRNRAESLLKSQLKSYFRIPNYGKRNDILNLIDDYYSRLPFNVLIWNKYQTKQCIIDSILLLDSKFNPYKACDAFKHVEKMLMNLVYSPWHREFRKIYTYSGQFKLLISDPLIGVEEVFKAAGFEYEKQDSIMNTMHLILPDNKMPQVDDGESVLSVIFDCMLAQTVLNNIIHVFESNFPKSLLKNQIESPAKLNGLDVNCYSWIQAYFRERSHQTTEKACSNIQELLSNIANLVPKIAEKNSNNQEQRTQFAERNNKTSNGHTVVKPAVVDIATGRGAGSPKSHMSAQERTREFLAQQQQANDHDHLITIPSDLLKLPPMGQTQVISATSSNLESGIRGGNGRNFGDSTDGVAQRNSSFRLQQQQQFRETNQQQSSMQNNGYNNVKQFHQQALFDRLPLNERLVGDEVHGLLENHSNSAANLAQPHRNDLSLSSHHSIEVDLPHNDRELLIPKYEKRLMSSQQQNIASNLTSNSKRFSIYDNNFDQNHIHPAHHQSSTSSSGGMSNHSGSRLKFEDPFFPSNNTTSHLNHHQYPHIQSSNHGSYNHQLHRPGLGGSLNQKYDNNSPSKKYNGFHEIDSSISKQTNSRSHWSCNCCTYNNLFSSEICEMCGMRRASHRL